MVSFLNENTTQTHNILTEKKLHDTGAQLEASVKIFLHLLNLHIGVLTLSTKGNRTSKLQLCAASCTRTPRPESKKLASIGSQQSLCYCWIRHLHWVVMWLVFQKSLCSSFAWPLMWHRVCTEWEGLCSGRDSCVWLILTLLC